MQIYTEAGGAVISTRLKHCGMVGKKITIIKKTEILQQKNHLKNQDGPTEQLLDVLLFSSWFRLI